MVGWGFPMKSAGKRASLLGMHGGEHARMWCSERARHNHSREHAVEVEAALANRHTALIARQLAQRIQRALIAALLNKFWEGGGRGKQGGSAAEGWAAHKSQ